MPFSVQYDKATGRNISSVNSIPPDENLPSGKAQLKFPDVDYIDTAGKIVDLDTLTLVDAPPEG